MKRTIYLMAIIITPIVIMQCEKDAQEILPVNNVNTILGGCNGQSFDDLKSIGIDENDTLQLFIRNDTLHVFTGINYICCAPFETSFSQSGDSLFFTMSDTCPLPYDDCYCRCMCYYTFDFLLTGFEKREYYLRIILNDPRQDKPTVFREGTVNISYK
jgi:hypothetical protein